ncbi:Z1 domain-containing protein [Glutamicibacter protophormiae]|uniref:Z1 domain-containing protein n=1 Tax=Glutamicibacter protophormiae TaxID=37930 RepID=UPI002A811F1B|nr:Z1 domain-containing protein [Glutamicibacter protophormiae]WPR64378.1 Z1 domain-containing protein [Glutamicibacter protophormiae]WPR67871.1 Z1 domain-containing protein [Glutamicibacter protophormiae]
MSTFGTDLEIAIRAAFDGMREVGPAKLLSRVNVWLEELDLEASEAQVIAAIVDRDGNAPARKAAHMCLAKWDAQTEAPWAEDTEPQTTYRRVRIFDKLGLSTSSREILDGLFPSVAQRDIVIANPGPWDPWYTAERKTEHDFYWNAYRGVLERSGWKPEAIANLDESTSDIVGRLSDPAGETSYQSKGLVVGYVQSGKTANFTGITAKAIDAGYRLIIVLTGTIELLRGQTQRRLDRELVGEENILGGRDRNNADAVRGVDYIGDGDSDWLDGKFLKHGIDINSQQDIPAIKRLTTASGDYKALKAGLDTLDYRRAGELKEPQKPLYDPVNLFSADVRLAVVKKNKSVLEKLLRDLHDVHASLKEIPVLIIDDEADQASVNTTNPKKAKTAEEKQRTAINKLISQILSEMPRAQYIGYTATPFANVFVSPDDSEDIFPRDFIVALEPSSEYMGGQQFHDLEPLPDDEPINASNSNAAAFMRSLYADSDEAERDEIRSALDAFVLSGAIKLWRAENNPEFSFRHHTMLAHESVKQSEHKDLAELIRDVWKTSQFNRTEGLNRLSQLYTEDFLKVYQSRKDWGAGMPQKFEALKKHIGAAIDLIMSDSDPVVIVNGSKESDYKAMDFATGRYWRVMVGGAKLSRGFTVEGLTVTYYRRRAAAADTLMQMGRWFGYRPGYRDLVRLYIARDVIDSKGKSYDLYDAFTAIIQDEEAFRAQLRKFSKLDENGRPEVRPIDVPPLVFQQLPWLKPTGANKMYNAVLDFEGDGGELRDFPRQIDRGNGSANAKHFAAVRSWLDRLGELTEFEYVDGREGEPRVKTFNSRVAIVSAEEMYRALEEFRWTSGYSFAPTLRFMEQAMHQGKLVDWAVLVPELDGIRMREIDGVSVQLLSRSRRRDRGGFSGSSFRQRAAIERIAGKLSAPGGLEAEKLDTFTRGAMLLTFASDPVSNVKAERDPEKLVDPIDVRDVATLFSLAVPYRSAPRGRIGFRVLDNSRRDSAIVDAI